MQQSQMNHPAAVAAVPVRDRHDLLA